MIPEENLWGLYGSLQQKILDAKIDQCIELVCKIHECCAEILHTNPSHKLALDMEFDFLPSMIVELCDLDMDRMQYIFGE